MESDGELPTTTSLDTILTFPIFLPKLRNEKTNENGLGRKTVGKTKAFYYSFTGPMRQQQNF